MTTTPPVQPALGVNQEAARQAEFLSVRTLAASPQRERRPWAEAPSTGSSASHQAAENYWQGRRDSVAAWLPHATRQAVEAFAMRHFDRAESAAWCIAEEHRRAELLAQREASYAVSAALDWTEQSRRPSYAELTRRRAVVD